MLVTEQNVNSMLRLLSKPKRLAVDTETTDLYTWHGARICGIAVGIPPASLRRCFYFPFRHESGDNLSKTRLRQLIGVLSRRDLIMTGWNFNKFDVHMLLAESMREPEYAEDVMLMLHLLNENERFMGGSYELKTAATRYVDPAARETQLAMKMRMADLGFQSHELWKLSPKEVAPYACADVYYTERLRERMIGPLREWRLDTIWHEVNRYALISRRFEERGLLLDVPLMRRYAKEAEKQVGRYERLIRKMAGYNINLNSNKQLQNWLGVFSTAKDALGRMKGKAPKALITYRQWFRVLSAYYRAYKERMDEHHVLHPNIKLHGTISGRLSAEDPNLQAVPRYTEVYKVKDIFIARPHHLLISADYSQMELRLGAHYARDEFLIGAFRTGKNVHAMTAKDFADLGVTYDSAKRINFAVQYGTGASSLAEEIGCTLERAQQFLDRMHKLHPNYRPLYRQIERHARKHGYIRLWTGRVRRFNQPNPEMWFHKALSNLIQGGVAEVMRTAILRLHEALHSSVYMLLQVHDQLLIETPAIRLKETIKTVRSEMTRDFPFSVPFVVDIKTGKRWGTLRERK